MKNLIVGAGKNAKDLRTLLLHERMIRVDITVIGNERKLELHSPLQYIGRDLIDFIGGNIQKGHIHV